MHKDIDSLQHGGKSIGSRQICQYVRIILGSATDERQNRDASSPQGTHKVTADEPVCAGNGNSYARTQSNVIAFSRMRLSDC